MKLVMILLFAVLAASVPMEKRNINEICYNDSDCGPNRCCLGGRWYRFCGSYLTEGQRCTNQKFAHCGCSAGLVCRGALYHATCVNEQSETADDYIY